MSVSNHLAKVFAAAELQGVAPLPEPEWRMPEHVLKGLPAPLRQAAVLVPLMLSGHEEGVLLTRRAAHLRNHGGQISFPGGAQEPSDSDAIATALRETEEEVGIAPDAVEIIGKLEPQPTITGFLVTPVLGRIADSPSFRLDPGEVAEVFEVPWSFLLDPDNRHDSQRHLNGIDFPSYEWRFGEHRIWGATAWMLRQLTKIIENNK